MAGKITNGLKAARKPVLVWHSAAHEHFKEQLYYLLLSVKPYDDGRFKADVAQLVGRYGVSQYCSYQVFGSFDILLRVWLPPQVFREFAEDAEKHIQNLSTMLHYQVLKKLQCSGFYGFRKDDSATLKQVLEDLTPEKVLKIQRDADPEELKRWVDRKVVRVRTKEEQEAEQKLIKAFVAFSEPLPGLPNKSREKIINDIANKLNGPGRLFTGVTLLEGTGFCWLFAKLVVKQFAELGRLAGEVSKEVGSLGVSTSTFLVMQQEDAIEGDSISDEALREYEPGNRKVAAFIPDLYKPGVVGQEKLDKTGIERFVLDAIMPAIDKSDNAQLDRDDLVAFKGYLEGVIGDDRDAAFVALFPRIINAESALRGPVVGLAKRCSGSVQGLIEELKKCDPKQVEKNAARLNLLDSLRAARWVLGHLLPEDAWCRDSLKDAVFQEVSVQRNTVAHGKDFQPRSDWKPLAEGMLNLFLLRSGITRRYQKLQDQAVEPRSSTSV